MGKTLGIFIFVGVFLALSGCALGTACVQSVEEFPVSCTDFVGSAYSGVLDVVQICSDTGGQLQATCPTEGSFGVCIFSKGTELETRTWRYDGDAAEQEALCGFGADWET